MKRGKGFRHYDGQREFKEQVLAGYQGLSGVSGEPADDAHHLIPKQTLSRYDIPETAADPRNGIALTRHEHESVHNGSLKLIWQILPSHFFEFAQENDMAWFVYKHYGEPKG